MLPGDPFAVFAFRDAFNRIVTTWLVGHDPGVSRRGSSGDLAD